MKNTDYTPQEDFEPIITLETSGSDSDDFDYDFDYDPNEMYYALNSPSE